MLPSRMSRSTRWWLIGSGEVSLSSMAILLTPMVGVEVLVVGAHAFHQGIIDFSTGSAAWT